MNIGIITPAPPRSRNGNRVTALRWQRILRGLGHRVTLAESYENERYDLLLALHARRSHPSIRRFHEEHPKAPLIVALTGTDLYRDLPRSRQAEESLELATRLVVLQPLALAELRPEFQRKARVIYQSVALRDIATRSKLPSAPAGPAFDVCVVGHLRIVKNPFLVARAARWLPLRSRIRVLHVGAATNAAFASRARAEMRLSPRYHWLGDCPRRSVFQLFRRSRLLVHPSRAEGGANVLSEAIVAGIPILASRIPGNVGLLGEDYPGYFRVGDRVEVARLLRRAETDATFLTELKDRCQKLAPLFDPRREKSAWAALLRELTPLPSTKH